MSRYTKVGSPKVARKVKTCRRCGLIKGAKRTFSLDTHCVCLPGLLPGEHEKLTAHRKRTGQILSTASEIAERQEWEELMEYAARVFGIDPDDQYWGDF